MNPESSLTQSQVLDELQKEVASNARLVRLLRRYGEWAELEKYRRSESVLQHESLIHLTACAFTVRKVIDELTAKAETFK